MTTTIKFRGFRVDGKGWVEGNVLNKFVDNDPLGIKEKSDYSSVLAIQSNPESFEKCRTYDIHPSSLGMFTGRTDKNGREIYGAIGEKGGDNLLYIGTNMSSMDVIFKDGMFVGVGSFNTHPLHTYFTATDFESIEIIGNQFEQNNGK